MTDTGDREEAAARRALVYITEILEAREWDEPLSVRQRWRIRALAFIRPQMVIQMAYSAASDFIHAIDPAQFRTDRKEQP